jgi:hypothetical protein
MGVIITMAIGKPVWGELALNLCLSIKANNPNQKVMLIHDDTAVSSIQPILSNCFDTLYTIGHSYKSCHNLAFNLKTQLHSIATKACVDETRFLYIDADCIFTTSAYNHDWFKELDGQGFAAWNNGYYDFESKERIRYHQMMEYILSITEIAQIFTLNNKLFVQIENDIRLFGNKNISDTERLFDIVKEEILKHLAALKKQDPEARINARIDKFSSMGVVHDLTEEISNN